MQGIKLSIVRDVTVNEEDVITIGSYLEYTFREALQMNVKNSEYLSEDEERMIFRTIVEQMIDCDVWEWGK